VHGVKQALSQRVSYRGMRDLPIPANMTPTQQKGFYYWSTVLYEYLSAADWDNMDWQLGKEYKLPGGDLLLYGGGFNAITDRLA